MAGDSAAAGEGTSDDQSNLLSELGTHDLAFTTSVGEPTGEDPFDADADPDGTFSQSVASGGPTPSTRPRTLPTPTGTSSPRTAFPRWR